MGSGDTLSISLFLVSGVVGAMIGAITAPKGWRAQVLWALAAAFALGFLWWQIRPSPAQAADLIKRVYICSPLIAAVIVMLARSARPDQNQTPPHKAALPVASLTEILPAPQGEPAQEVSLLVERAPHAQEEPRVFVGKEVTVERLASFFEVGTGLDAKRLLSPYIGKWMKVRGVFDNASHSARMCSVSFKSTPFSSKTAFCMFEESWLGRLEMLQRGQEIALLGRISQADRHGCALSDCELISLSDAADASWAGDRPEPTPPAKPGRKRAAKPRSA